MRLLPAATALLLLAAGPDYKASVGSWRRDHETALRSDSGWLTVAGLYWLREGANRAGTDPTLEIVLPAGSAPARAGVFEFRQGRTSFRAEPGVQAVPPAVPEMRPDTEGPPDRVSIAALTMHVIKRGARYGIRLADKNSPLRRQFTGLRWFPADETYRVTARFVAYQPPRKIAVPTVLGDEQQQTTPGYAEFEIRGRSLRLEPIEEEPGKLLHFSGPDQRSRDLSRGPLPLHRTAEERQCGARFQPGREPSLRLHALRDLPAPASPESLARAHSGR